MSLFMYTYIYIRIYIYIYRKTYLFIAIVETIHIDLTKPSPQLERVRAGLAPKFREPRAGKAERRSDSVGFRAYRVEGLGLTGFRV